MEDIFSYRRLRVYQEARLLVKAVYEISASFPAAERFGLTSQLQRAIISVPSNISESCGRRSLKEKIHFIEIAFGSLTEASCQLELASDLGYISDETISDIAPSFTTIAQMLSGLVNSYETKIKAQQST